MEILLDACLSEDMSGRVFSEDMSVFSVINLSVDSIFFSVTDLIEDVLSVIMNLVAFSFVNDRVVPDVCLPALSLSVVCLSVVCLSVVFVSRVPERE